MGTTKRVSVGSDGAEANGPSYSPAISGDGRFVAFQSYATNLAADDTNGTADVFVHDRRTGRTERVSVGPGGRDGPPCCQGSGAPTLSETGRFVAFDSDRDQLVDDDTNNENDVFVRDRQSGRITRVSVDSDGDQADRGSFSPAISADGRFVAFQSSATNLAPNDTNGRSDVFVRDRRTGITERVSLGPAGRQANGDSFLAALSANGRTVGFFSFATNLVRGDTNDVADAFARVLDD
jgi:Tol biopolymer transport system component